jgi:hypothetical protein
MKLEFINPADLHNCWFSIRQGLEVVLERTGEDYLPEDVYAAIKAGTAYLYVFDTGFTVLVNSKAPYTNEPVLFVWIAYHATHEDLQEEFYAELKKMAKTIGASKITWNSPRRWERRSGAKLVAYSYELPVNDIGEA